MAATVRRYEEPISTVTTSEYEVQRRAFAGWERMTGLSTVEAAEAFADQITGIELRIVRRTMTVELAKVVSS